MKIQILGIICAAFLSCTSCSDFLDEHMKNTLGTDAYSSSYGFELAANGLYGWARSEFNTWGGGTTSQGQACPYEAFQAGTDIVQLGLRDGSVVPFQNMSYTPLTTFVRSYWNWGYGLIASSNEMLKYSDINTNWDKESDKVYYQAIARFFRAYAYRYLVYLYGDVPYVDKIEDKYRIDFTRTPKAEVLQHMIDDLTFASENLPTDPDKVEPGQLTKWAAEHMLSEVYLMASKYAEAEKAADNVINSGYFQLMKDRFGVDRDKAGDVFSDMFLENNQNRTSGNKESIWVMQLEYNTTGGGGEYEDWTKRAWVPKYFNKKGIIIADSLGGRGMGQIAPLKWWIEGNGFYDKTDIRNSRYNIKRDWYYNDPTSENYGKKVEISDADWDQGVLFPVPTKFFYGVIDKGGDASYGGNNKDRIKFRLAETYLLKAEACIRQNKLQDAADAINVVRARAHASLITKDQVTMDFLLDERIRELVGEELRRFTLVRTGKLVERTKKYNQFSQDIDEHNTLWPIPQEIINSNTGAEFPQNPGF